MAKPINRPGDDIDFLTKEIRARGLEVDFLRLDYEPGPMVVSHGVGVYAGPHKRTATVRLTLYDGRRIAPGQRHAAWANGVRAFDRLREAGIEDGEHHWRSVDSYVQAKDQGTITLERQPKAEPKPPKPAHTYVEELEEILRRELDITLRRIKVTESCGYNMSGSPEIAIRTNADVEGLIPKALRYKLWDGHSLRVPGEPYVWRCACGEIDDDWKSHQPVRFTLTRLNIPRLNVP